MNPNLETFVTSSNVDVRSGTVAFQLPINYGGTGDPTVPWFTTLRIENLPVGEQNFAVTDLWVTSQPIKDSTGAPIKIDGVTVGAGFKLPLADWAALFASMGDVKVLGYAVQANAAAEVDSITANGTKYTFAPYVAPSVTSTVKVFESQIQTSENPDGSNYSQWHEGTTPAPATPAFRVTDDGLQLGIGSKSQILKGLDAAITDRTIGELIAGVEVEVENGSVTYQIPILTGPTATSTFLTLHSQGLTAGHHEFDLDSLWRSSKALPGVVAFQDYPLSFLLDQLTNVRVLGFGVQTDAGAADANRATVSSITFDRTKYTFELPIQPGSPTITGTPAFGKTLTASKGTWAPSGLTYTYEWKAGAVVLGTSSTYAPVIGDIGHAITLVVTGHKSGYADVSASSASVTVLAGHLTAGIPTITGTPTVGQTLTAVTGSWSPSGVSYTYQWRANGTAISGATGTTFVPTASQLGKTISVVVTGTKTGYTTRSAISTGRGPIAAGALTAGAPTITGTPTVGETLSAVTGSWAPAGVSFTYQWKANGSPIAGATASTYVLTGAEAGATIAVVVTGHLAGYTDKSATSPGVSPVALGTLSAGSPIITGTAAIGSTLTASPGAWGPTPVELDYQWSSDGVPLVGATGATYRMTFTDAGHSLSVTVTGSKLGYITASVESPPTLSLPTDAIPIVERIAGDDRFETAVKISQGFAAGVERVYVVTGANYPDALSAAAAAAHLDAPLLLTTPDSVPAVVITELERLAPHEIVIVGSTSAVSNAVKQQLKSLPFAPTVTRIGGKDRYETSQLIAAEAFDFATTAYVATGANFPDALTAGPAAAHFDGPVVLVPGGDSAVDVDTLQLLANLGVTTVKIAGASAAVSDGIEHQLKQLFTVKRNAGQNRFETAVAINKDEFTSAATVYLATGMGYADALAGAARAGHEGAPLFVSNPNCVSLSVMSAIVKLSPSTVVLLGGKKALSAEVEDLEVCS